MRFAFRSLTAALALSIVAGAGQASADERSVPTTGSERGVTVPHASPEGSGPHVPGQQGHVIAPKGAVPETGAAQGVAVPNATPGVTPGVGEAQPHADVQSPRGVVPSTGSEQGSHSR
jgi:hypothetical protein